MQAYNHNKMQQRQIICNKHADYMFNNAFEK